MGFVCVEFLARSLSALALERTKSLEKKTTLCYDFIMKLQIAKNGASRTQKQKKKQVAVITKV